MKIKVNNYYIRHIIPKNEMFNPNSYDVGYYTTFIPKQRIINQCGYFQIEVKGLYTIGNNYLRLPTVLGQISGIRNFTNLQKTIYLTINILL